MARIDSYTQKTTLDGTEIVLGYDTTAEPAILMDVDDLSTYINGQLTLGTAASRNVSDFATAAQGALADSAIQQSALDTQLATKLNVPSGQTVTVVPVIDSFGTQSTVALSTLQGGGGGTGSVDLTGIPDNAILKKGPTGTIDATRITDNNVIVNVDAGFRVEGCIDLHVPEADITIPATGTEVTTTAAGGDLAGSNDIEVNNIGSSAVPSTTVVYGSAINFPSFSSEPIKIVTTLQYDIRGTEDRIFFRGQTLSQTITEGTGVNVLPSTMVGTVKGTSNVSDVTVTIDGDVTSTLSMGSVVFFRESSDPGNTASSAYNGTRVLTAVAYSEGNDETLLTFEGGLTNAVRESRNDQVWLLSGATTSTVPAQQVAIIERDLTRFHSQNITLDVGGVNPNLMTGRLKIQGVPTGTLESPPTGMTSGDIWLDTTDSTTHPALRISTTST